MCNIFGILCVRISREVKMQLRRTRKKVEICAVCGEGV